MRSCIFVFYIALFVAPAAGSCAAAAADPDLLYRGRTDPASARAAAAIWDSRLTANPGDFESAWKLARPEGHFWMAASMGALAESFGLRQGLRYRGAIKDALDTVRRLDPGFQNGSADRALGRWYYKVPRLFGGSNAQSEAPLRASLRYAQNSTASHLFLADTLTDLHRDADAREELQKVMAAPIDPEWEPEDRDFKAQAAERLAAPGRR